MKSLIVDCMLLAAFCLYAMAADPPGQVHYDKSCKTCHAADGSGNQGIAKALKVVIRPLGSKEVQAKSDADLKKDITQGAGKMKPVAGLSARQVDEVVAFLRTLKK